jgi:hypothetical protein
MESSICLGSNHNELPKNNAKSKAPWFERSSKIAQAIYKELSFDIPKGTINENKRNNDSSCRGN